MAKIPNSRKYQKPEDDIHPRLAERRYEVQQERMVNGMFSNGGIPVDTLLGEKWDDLDK